MFTIKKRNIFLKFFQKNIGYSGCLAVLLILLLSLATGVGWFYLQWLNVEKIGAKDMQLILEELAQNKELENLTSLESLEAEDIMRFKRIHPWFLKIYKELLRK